MSSFFYTQDESAKIDTRGRVRGADGRAVVRSVVIVDPHVAGGSPSTTGRKEVNPPALFLRRPTGWVTWLKGFWLWLWDMDAPVRSDAAPAQLLIGVRNEFIAAVWDLQSPDAARLRAQIERARSLRELWHLRAEVFNTISAHRGQLEAQGRLDGLDAHFPVRTSKRVDEQRHGRASCW